jgi:hypothetical protein
VWLVGKPKIHSADGLAALALWKEGKADSATVALAVRFTLQELAALAPGASVEVRVPPYGAIQIIEGTSHTRGTPPAVVEMNSDVWLSLATGRVKFEHARARGDLSASGQRSDLTALLPLWGLI